jgi:hydroxymethylpyrimidine/phosphomethylpyrimidine kinase
VIDPVMLSSSGHRLLGEGLERALLGRLFPLATVVTPNVPEAEALCGFPVESKRDMERAARSIAESASVGALVKGGHFSGEREGSIDGSKGAGESCDDFFFRDESGIWFSMPRVATKNTHGTGCALSSAIAANLALGHSVTDSVGLAKRYLHSAISRGLSLGKGKGPLDLGP